MSGCLPCCLLWVSLARDFCRVVLACVVKLPVAPRLKETNSKCVHSPNSVKGMGCSTDSEEWNCPVCLDLLYKPCALRCGHVACFWYGCGTCIVSSALLTLAELEADCSCVFNRCMHKAMSPYTDSKCPLCREHYVHLPAVSMRSFNCSCTGKRYSPLSVI